MPMPVAQPPYLSYTLQSIPPQYLRSSISSPDLRHARQSQPQINQEYQLSTNPPNIRTSFRTGDWICHNPACAAHNFTRNPICIGCSTPRPSVPGTSTTVPGVRSGDISPSPGTNSPLSPGSPSPPGSLLYNPNNQNQNPTLHIASPRFLQNNHHHHNLNQTFPNNGNGSLSLPSSPSSNINPSFSFTSSLQSISSLTTNPAPSLSSLTSSASGTTTQLTLGPGNQLRPLPSILTPTGRAFAVGGRVRNVSPNPLSPCVLFWPDNEDLPSEGQVRPVYSGTPLSEETQALAPTSTLFSGTRFVASAALLDPNDQIHDEME
ncbi:hypothetical protein SISNIDRAFT_247138 [Sistotremastrum niveocremeum HHB9708]|uniref:RanBP2-type domain-containing protein n=1 Tax=Sistotremastrum niveocremeum HHB9708 TaxID=1314777 RepID=A0A164YRT6_9AGAM|nr:hypothetical protein SISNIDRAFT_247138 [Sistotremastrum niveocremeum HHB9708]